jgi:hypothetical protein
MRLRTGGDGLLRALETRNLVRRLADGTSPVDSIVLPGYWEVWEGGLELDELPLVESLRWVAVCERFKIHLFSMGEAEED